MKYLDLVQQAAKVIEGSSQKKKSIEGILFYFIFGNLQCSLQHEHSTSPIFQLCTIFGKQC